jgi:hypothetical protein
MARLLRAFPLLPGKREAFETFVAELKARHAETDAFYQGHGVVRETAHLQSTPHGDLVIVCTDLGDDVQQAATSYAEATAPFQAWFKAKVLEFSGIDPNTQPLGPECSCVLDWQDTKSLV